VDDRTDDIMLRKIFNMLDVNSDGKVDALDMKKALFRYEWIVVTGLLLTIIPMGNVLGYTNIDSDFFWALAGLCLTVEGVIELYYEQKHWDTVKGNK
jgi:Ca2+-binding EF-hand superfamily protein